MIMLIIIFASIFSHVIALLGTPKALLGLVTGLNLAPWMVFAMIFAILILIAYALEELSVMIIMLPILFPLVTGLGFDPVWFGIVMIVWLEMGFITPPVGINLFVIQGVARGSTHARHRGRLDALRPDPDRARRDPLPGSRPGPLAAAPDDAGPAVNAR